MPDNHDIFISNKRKNLLTASSWFSFDVGLLTISIAGFVSRFDKSNKLVCARCPKSSSTSEVAEPSTSGAPFVLLWSSGHHTELWSGFVVYSKKA